MAPKKRASRQKKSPGDGDVFPAPAVAVAMDASSLKVESRGDGVVVVMECGVKKIE